MTEEQENICRELTQKRVWVFPVEKNLPRHEWPTEFFDTRDEVKRKASLVHVGVSKGACHKIRGNWQVSFCIQESSFFRAMRMAFSGVPHVADIAERFRKDFATKDARAGRPIGKNRKYGEPTVHITFRVPESKLEAITNAVNAMLDQYDKNNHADSQSVT